jgi:hypothetical protein
MNSCHWKFRYRLRHFRSLYSRHCYANHKRMVETPRIPHCCLRFVYYDCRTYHLVRDIEAEKEPRGSVGPTASHNTEPTPTKRMLADALALPIANME